MNSNHTTTTMKNRSSKKAPSHKVLNAHNFYYKSKWPYVRKILRQELRPVYMNTAMYQAILAFLTGSYNTADHPIWPRAVLEVYPMLEFCIAKLGKKNKLIIDPTINSATARLGLNAIDIAQDIMNVVFKDGTPACVIETYGDERQLKAPLNAVAHVIKHHMDRKHKHWYEGNGNNKCKTSSG